MFKKIAIAAPLTLLVLGASTVFAEDAKFSVNIEATVPSNGQYVTPARDLVDSTRRMDWDNAIGDMRNVLSYVDLRNNAGDVSAYLESEAKLYSGANTIPLKVTLNNKEITQTETPVVGDDESNANYRAVFEIKAVTNGVLPPEGAYTGVVTPMFVYGIR